MNTLRKYAAKKQLSKELLRRIAKSKKRDTTGTKKLPSWAKPYMYVEGGMHKVKKWPEDSALRARVEMLQAGRQNTKLHRHAPHRAPGSGRPEGGWPEGSAMAAWRRLAGRG